MVENSIKLLPEEYTQQSKIASELYNKLGLTGQKLTLHQMFILGFIHGRQHTLEDIGILDGDDDKKIYDFLERLENDSSR